MTTTSWKQNDDDIISFFHEFQVNMIHMILLPSFIFILNTGVMAMGVGKKPSPNRVK